MSGTESQAVESGYREHMDEMWRMMYYLSSQIIVAPYQEHKSVERTYHHLLSIAFPGDAGIIEPKKPSEMMEQIQKEINDSKKYIR